ncbi:membrane oxidoreductase [Jiangella aurantiaca]|uniref:Membrane oxidoreductase n=1 Tax=Jiangella aurantiaca TaxID=2530373 RepID=A0A4V6PED2_9ACTN|nr:SRPBCC family protein [Jiangella aurantiaca]TDD65207.1 membrane oxidoreductase [Jiangella aurantiaca]
MQIDNQFTVGVPVERAWEVLTDLEDIAPCMPGAQLTGVEGDVYSGRIKVKVGPVVSEYAGTAAFVEKDDAGHRAVISASGRDSRGAGNASARIVAQLRPEGDRTVVTVDTELRITGRIAQLGRGMIKEVSTKLLGQFVDCLESKLGAPAEAPPAPATEVPEVAATTPDVPIRPRDESAGQLPPVAGEPAGTPYAAEPEPLDIMGVSGGSIVRRAIPLVLVLVVLVGLVIYLATR